VRHWASDLASSAREADNKVDRMREAGEIFAGAWARPLNAKAASVIK
jgi:hypothetical protein